MDEIADTVGHTSSAVTERIYKHAFDREKREERMRQMMEQAA